MNTHEQTAESTTTQEPASPSQQEQIGTLSYLVWESEGCPEGRDAEHWREAEKIHATHGIVEDDD